MKKATLTAILSVIYFGGFGQSDTIGTINDSYMIAIGRPPSKAETYGRLLYVRTNGLDLNNLIKLHTDYIKIKDSLQKDIIRYAYQDLSGSYPTPKEVINYFMTSRKLPKGFRTYGDMCSELKNHLKANPMPLQRNAIYNAYKDGFGRVPDSLEYFSFFNRAIQRGGLTYLEILGELRIFLSSHSEIQKDIIVKSYDFAGIPLLPEYLKNYMAACNFGCLFKDLVYQHFESIKQFPVRQPSQVPIVK